MCDLAEEFKLEVETTHVSLVASAYSTWYPVMVLPLSSAGTPQSTLKLVEPSDVAVTFVGAEIVLVKAVHFAYKVTSVSVVKLAPARPTEVWKLESEYQPTNFASPLVGVGNVMAVPSVS